MMGGGGEGSKCPPPLLFLFVNTIEKVIRLCTVLKFFFRVVVFRIGPFFKNFLFVFCWCVGWGGGEWGVVEYIHLFKEFFSQPKMGFFRGVHCPSPQTPLYITKSGYILQCQNRSQKFTFSIVFTNKNRVDRINPTPP